MDAELFINVTGKVCPLPLITLAKAARTMTKGQLLTIAGDDPVFEESVLDFLREGGHELVANRREGKKVTITFRF